MSEPAVPMNHSALPVNGAAAPMNDPAAPSPAPLPKPAPRWKILLVWSKQELLLLLREPVAIFFSLVFPLMMYVFIGIPYGSEATASGVRVIDVMFPALILAVAANLLIMGLPIYMAELRSRGVDRRYAILPLPAWILVVAILSALLFLVAGAAAVILLVVGVRDGLLPAAASPVFIALIIGTIAWLSSVGFFVGSLRLSPRAIQTLAAVLFFTMFFGSGAAVPLEGLPDPLKDAMDWNPLKQWLDVAAGVYTGTELASEKWFKLLPAVLITLFCSAAGLFLWKRR